MPPFGDEIIPKGAAGMSLAACAALLERGDAERFLALMAAPVAMRRVLLPLYAVNLEIARAPWTSREPLIAEMRLQWWRDALAELAAGGPPRAHELLPPLAEALGDRAAELGCALDALIEARRRDIERAPFADTAALSAYLEATGGTLSWIAGRLAGAGPGHEPALRAAGWAFGLAGYLRAVPELEARGRLPLPDGRPAAVAGLARAGLDRLARARRAGLPGGLAPVLRTGWLAGPVLRRAARTPQAVAAGGLAPSPFAARARLLGLGLSGSW